MLRLEVAVTSKTQTSAALDRSLTVSGRARNADGRLDPATLTSYQRSREIFVQWRREQKVSRPLPCTSEDLAEYAAAMLQRGYASSTIRGHLSAVNAWHRERGEPVPDGVPAWFVLRAADLTTTDTPEVNSRPLGRGALLDAARACDLDRVAGVRDLCLLTLAWDLYAGESELVGLDIEDLTFAEDGMTVRVADGWIAVGHDHEPELVCPWHAARRWVRVLAEAGATSGPLLRPVDKAGNIGGCGRKCGPSAPGGRLRVRGLRRVWARLVARAGLPPCTPRSLRLSGAVDDLVAGDDLVAVLRRGRWSESNATALHRLVRMREDLSGQADEG